MGRNVDTIVRLTGDCPALDPAVASKTLALFLANRPIIDFADNDTLSSGYPDGWDVEVFSIDALEQANARAKPSEREHVTRWMKKHLRCKTLMAEQPWTGPKLSVDTQDDLAVVSQYLNGTLINVLVPFSDAPDGELLITIQMSEEETDKFINAAAAEGVSVNDRRPVKKRGKKA